MSRRVYLAAQYTRREELQLYAAQLETRGHRVVSSWLRGDKQDERAMSTEEKGRIALGIVDEVESADTVVAFTEGPDCTVARGGRHVETGIAIPFALASSVQARIYVVGPRENIFHCLPGVERFDTFRQLLNAL